MIMVKMIIKVTIMMAVNTDKLINSIFLTAIALIKILLLEW